ncbi:MAG TPA: ABC transporter substrate-binding protein [Dehalococcoidia bacterium]|nr:ABC transporter substrate-binding protein [Dehalococcoidia bacterium]
MAEIVIGTSLPQTGPYAETQFLQYSRAYDLWVRDVNAAGGMLGRQVRLLWHDDFGQPERCEENFKRLIHEDKVDLLLGPCHSILIEPMAHVTEEAHMLLLEGSGSVSEMFRKGRQWLFLCWDADCNYMKSFLEFMSSPSNPKRVSKVGTVSGNRPRGLGHAMGVHQHAKALGLEVAWDERTSGEVDYADVFRRGKATGAEVVMWDIEARGDDKKRAIAAAVDAGFAPSQLWLSESPGQKVESGVFSRVTWLPSDPRPMSKKFLADFIAMSGVEPEYHSAGGYACGQVLQQAVAATGSLDNEKLREAVLSMTFETVMGSLRYGKDGLPVASFPVAQWQDGTPELVYPNEAKTRDAVFI